MGSNRNPLTKEQVVAAAVECIERFGVAKTSMIDIARLLGVTRQTVHRLFETRAALFEAVAEERIEAAGLRLRSIFARFDDIEEALVSGSLQSLAVGRSDDILYAIQQQADHQVDQYMFRGSPQIQEMMVGLWGPVLDRARAAGRIRDGLDNDRIVHWVRNVHAMLTMRIDYSEEQKAQLLRDFFVPSIVK
ncbi:AcrR family transcriptional regulator [Sphingopyxis panaciterrae]|uniref:TetR/AcrR family transcriptional regulator n=1 Tax=Sphingopyxis panaciterrae TaxID=363841 RepID=UPI00141DD19D|nr:TetR/AcrR family transcriptional regulator [Sphingopyxis panaciterrae]NIJ35950.1 AcrR family transcriptional regulator [Sphingopyxis panaciterrae]